MKIINFALILQFASISSFANDYSVLDKAYDKYYSSANVQCAYMYFKDVPRIKVIEQSHDKNRNIVEASFLLNDSRVDIQITSGSERGIVNRYAINGVNFNANIGKNIGNPISKSGIIGYNEIYLNLSNLNAEQEKLHKELNLDFFRCNLEMGSEKVYTLSDKKVHINMHPHANYDLDSESVPGTLREYAKSAQHLLLLDHSVSNKAAGSSGDFNSFSANSGVILKAPKGFSNPIFDIPQMIDIRVAQSGHSDYELQQVNHEVTFSGGNHNYCVINGTRRVLLGFFENKNSERITFNYPTDALVVQKGITRYGVKTNFVSNSFIPGKIFKKSNMLSEIFKIMDEKQIDRYLRSIYDYHANRLLKEKVTYYKSLTFIQRGITGYDRTEVFKGSGKKDLTIIFQYK